MGRERRGSGAVSLVQIRESCFASPKQCGRAIGADVTLVTGGAMFARGVRGTKADGESGWPPGHDRPHPHERPSTCSEPAGGGLRCARIGGADSRVTLRCWASPALDSRRRPWVLTRDSGVAGAGNCESSSQRRQCPDHEHRTEQRDAGARANFIRHVGAQRSEHFQV